MLQQVGKPSDPVSFLVTVAVDRLTDQDKFDAPLIGQRARFIQNLPGRTSLFVVPGFRFRCVDALLTNFHLPRSTLLALVMAFAGVEVVRELYREAIAERYRFYSFGDAMLVL